MGSTNIQDLPDNEITTFVLHLKSLKPEDHLPTTDLTPAWDVIPVMFNSRKIPYEYIPVDLDTALVVFPKLHYNEVCRLLRGRSTFMVVKQVHRRVGLLLNPMSFLEDSKVSTVFIQTRDLKGLVFHRAVRTLLDKYKSAYQYVKIDDKNAKIYMLTTSAKNISSKLRGLFEFSVIGVIEGLQ